jgi:thymidylate kinase
MEYQRRVREGFLAQAAASPDRYLVIDATKEPDAVFRSLLAELERRITGM